MSCAPQKKPLQWLLTKSPLYQFIAVTEASYPFLFLFPFQDVLWWGIGVQILSTSFWKKVGSFYMEMRRIIAYAHKWVAFLSLMLQLKTKILISALLMTHNKKSQKSIMNRSILNWDRQFRKLLWLYVIIEISNNIQFY